MSRFRIFFFFSFLLETLAEWLVILVNVTTVPPSSGDDVMMLYRSVVLGRHIHIYTYIQQYTPRNKNDVLSRRVSSMNE